MGSDLRSYIELQHQLFLMLSESHNSEIMQVFKSATNLPERWIQFLHKQISVYNHGIDIQQICGVFLSDLVILGDLPPHAVSLAFGEILNLARSNTPHL